MRGRKPVPTELKILRGNPGQRPLNALEPQPEQAATLDPPDYLDDQGRREWVAKAPMLQRLGLLTEADLDTFGLYCQTFARWKHAQKQIALYGMVHVTEKTGSLQISPWLSIANKAQSECQKLLVEFGCTPSSRSRVTVSKRPSANQDADKERFFGRNRSA